MQIVGRTVADDVSVGTWLTASLPGTNRGTVSSLIPPQFEAYARVFHPAVRYPDDWELATPSEEPDADVTWAEVAAFNGRTAHPAMEWASITGSTEFVGHDDQPGMWNDSPAQGHLPVSVATRLADVLERHTTTPAACWFGVDATWHRGQGPTLYVDGIDYLLVHGPVELAATNFADEPVEQSANLWWPDDRAWFVSTHIDLMTTYVGASAACIAEIVAHPGLEAAEVSVSQGTSRRSDTVNPLPFDGPD